MEPRRPPRPSPALRRALALGLGLVLALALAEAGYRLLRGGRTGPTTNPRYVMHDERLGWRYRPGTRTRHATEEFDVRIEIGARGFRGPWPAPAPGRGRVLVLGDSFAFGWGVEAGEALAGVLAELEPGWQAWNAGVSGFGTDQQLLLLEELRAELEPHVVVSVFCANDLEENLSSRAHGRRKPWFSVGPDGGLELQGVPVPEAPLERASHLYRALVKLLVPVERVAMGEDEAWRVTLALSEAMAGGGPLVIVSDRPRLAALAAAHGSIHHVDIAPLLAELGPRAHFVRDGHWTATTHRRVAEAVADTLRALIPPDPR